MKKLLAGMTCCGRTPRRTVCRRGRPVGRSTLQGTARIAFAADAAYNWTGLYFGVNGGGGWGRSWWSGNATGLNVSGGLIGGTAGYNWQTSNVVLGVEGDVDWSRLQGDTISTLCPNGCSTSDTWLSTLRGHVGLFVRPRHALPHRRSRRW